MKKIFPLSAIVFLAAFLLFQAELMISKAILPAFGGSYLVWSVCVMFFQGVLLLGYLYAHIVARKFGIIRYFRFHLILLSLTLFFLLGDLVGNARPERLPFVIEIIYLLVRRIGPLFLALSATSIIIQSRLAASDLPQRANPYVLYGTSNLGAFAALLSYPFIFEPLFDLKIQWDIWRVLYLILVVFHFTLLTNRFGRRAPSAAGPREAEIFGPIPKKELARWFLFSSAAAAMFLAVTNVITLDLAPVPLLWVLPLGIYLLSFVLNFKRRPWYPLWLANRFYQAVPLGIVLFLTMARKMNLPFLFILPVHLGILFIFCMVCNGELYRSRPSGRGHLTSFYLVVAAGGLAGSALVSWVIPPLSASLVEYLFGFLLAALALSLGVQDKSACKRWCYLLVPSVILLVILWPVVLCFGSYFDKFVASAAGVLLVIIFFFLRRRPKMMAVALLGTVGVSPFIDFYRTGGSLVHQHRNFYGIYRVSDRQGKRILMHGSTLHGAQYLGLARQEEALAYYHETAPGGELMSSPSFNFQTTGIIGLGAGSLSVYTGYGGSVDFYELDPDNGEIAERYFKYLRNCAGNLRLIFGDGRLSLSRVEDNYYDLLVVDAFNSDSIPVHLLTVEALSEYRRCLQKDGIILFHISNRCLNLKPVLAAGARELSLEALSKTNCQRISDHPDAEASTWVALTPDRDVARKLVQELKWVDLKTDPRTGKIRPWTDRYSNLLAALLAKD